MIRKATVKDVEAMKNIINAYAKQEKMLPRSYNELYQYIRSFYVYEKDEEVIGCCALQVVWEDLAEILSFAVKPEYARKGIGSQLLKACMGDAHELQIKKIFTLTYVPEFFEKHGFTRVDKSTLPHKVWSGCINCPKFPDCDEIALIKTIE
ncbi:N-acetyltransferase [Methanomethylovorans sp.]|uniref:N-acetyltransferase n=1 Tax=Methanomethylovorans sp. TaxID=2758717 RepID=UPI00351C8147